MTKKEFNIFVSKVENCIATITTSVVKRFKYDADCGETMCSLYNLWLRLETVKRSENYDCITTEELNWVINSINKICQETCGGTSSGPQSQVVDNQPALATGSGNFIVTSSGDYILIT